MDPLAAKQILQRLPASALVVDVGGGAAPFSRANVVIDAIAYASRDQLGAHDLGIVPHYSQDSWLQVDLCDRRPWPVADKAFDFATCSHLLEDVRDPIWICSELSRVAKAGYIEVPSRIVEQSLGIEHPGYAGYYHHRWLITEHDGQLLFRHKPHQLHVTRGAIVARVGGRTQLNPQYATTQLWWQDRITCREVLEFCENRVVDELCSFAARARQLPNLLLANDLSMVAAAKKRVYYARLRLGYR